MRSSPPSITRCDGGGGGAEGSRYTDPYTEAVCRTLYDLCAALKAREATAALGVEVAELKARVAEAEGKPVELEEKIRGLMVEKEEMTSETARLGRLVLKQEGDLKQRQATVDDLKDRCDAALAVVAAAVPAAAAV